MIGPPGGGPLRTPRESHHPPTSAERIRTWSPRSSGVAGSFTNSSPFRLLLIAVGVAYTLVARTAVEDSRIWDRDWLWTSLGVLLYYAANVVVDPVTAMIYPQSPTLALMVYFVKAIVDLCAYLMVWKGMRSPVESPRPTDMFAT